MVVDDPADTVEVEAETDKISGLPDDVLLDILGRLVTAGDARAVARTSTLSRRWRSLPWPDIHTVFLDVGNFLRSDGDEPPPRQHARRRKRRRPVWKQNQHDATAALTGALARFLAAPASRRVVGTLRLRLILTRRGYVRRIGELVGAAAATGAVRGVELELAAETEARAAPCYGERFGQFRRDCPGAFRSLTKLTLRGLWFHDMAELNGLVRGCDALAFLSLTSCGVAFPKPSLPPAMDGGGEATRRPALTIDAPWSRVQVLLCDLCHFGGVELVQAPALAGLRYRADVLEGFDSAAISIGCAPSLKCLYISQHQGEESSVRLKLTELLANVGGQLERLILAFQNGKIWLQPGCSKQLRAALRGLKYLNLTNISPGCDLSWATFLLEAAPFLEILAIDICNHICLNTWHQKGDEDASLVAWEQPSSDFRHHHLKQLYFKRAFHVEKDLLFARLVMGLAVNLQAVTLGVKSLQCPGCIDAQRKYPDLTRSRLRFTEGSEYVDAFVKELMDGIATSAKITLLLSDLV
ncbi:unnamed protein product [Urochloa decumbens]|uniref:F-box domain-containing protein n=1 Tax=Urochloa decumbens TaxID=240449 RepID=A0ABC8ZVG4_9POAL